MHYTEDVPLCWVFTNQVTNGVHKSFQARCVPGFLKSFYPGMYMAMPVLAYISLTKKCMQEGTSWYTFPSPLTCFYMCMYA